MFAGLQHLGGIEAALVSLLELLVSLSLAFALLGDRLTGLQWTGGIVLIASILLGGIRGSRAQQITVFGWEDGPET